MKKILTIALVAVLAATSVFAGVNFSGGIKTGYALTWNKDGDFAAYQYGSDKTDSNMAELDLAVADENGLWNATLNGAVSLNGDDYISGSLTLDAAKILSAALDKDLPVSAKLSLVGPNNNVAGLRAYSNKSSNNYDRLRTDRDKFSSLKTNVVVAYEKLVQVQFAVAPKLSGSSTVVEENYNTIVTSVLFAPVDGVKASVDYGYNSDFKYKHAIAGAANVDISKLADLDFTIGLAASDKYGFNDSDNFKNIVAVEVYGNVKGIALNAEYALTTAKADAGDTTNTHGLHLGADFSALVENTKLDAYFGSKKLNEFSDNWYVGGDIGYKLSGITLNLGLEYNKGGQKNVGSNAPKDSFVLVPSISVAF